MRADLVLPRQLVDLVVEDRDSFAEDLVVQANPFQDLAGIEFDLAQRGFPLDSGPFIQRAIVKDETLAEGIRRVRVFLDDPIRQHGRLRLPRLCIRAEQNDKYKKHSPSQRPRRTENSPVSRTRLLTFHFDLLTSAFCLSSHPNAKTSSIEYRPAGLSTRYFAAANAP